MILVTGGMGFIGLHVVKALLDAGQDVVVTWNHSWRVPDFWGDELGKRIIAEKLDVSSTFDVLNVAKKHNIDSIIHLATPVVGTATPAQDYLVNVQGVVNLMEAARLVGARRLTFASSSTLYTGLPGGPYREDAPLPLKSGSATEAFKKIGETLMFHYAERIGLNVAAIRPRAVYGPMYYSMINLPSRLSHAAVKGVEPDFGPAGAPFADDSNDFTYVKDCAEVFRLVHLADTLKYPVYNVGGGRAFRMQEVADAVLETIPTAKAELKPGSNPRGNPKDNYLELSRVKEEFGFTPRFPIERGVPDYIDWLRTHPQ
jgi:UDP-glucose 4-epimerase